MCRLCHISVEGIMYVIKRCPNMFLLVVRHNIVATIVYNAIRRKDCSEINFGNPSGMEYIHRH